MIWMQPLAGGASQRFVSFGRELPFGGVFAPKPQCCKHTLPQGLKECVSGSNSRCFLRADSMRMAVCEFLTLQPNQYEPCNPAHDQPTQGD